MKLKKSILLVLAVALAEASTYTVTAYYPNELSSLFLRGEGCGLSWNQGVFMKKVT